jgi:hypothetical protein
MNEQTMTGSDLLRVHRGAASTEELAALIAVLHSRTRALDAEPQPAARGTLPLAGWRRPERHSAYTDPRAWHRGHGV